MGFLLTGNDFGQWKPFEQLHPAEFRQRVSYIRAVQVHNITYITVLWAILLFDQGNET